MPTGGWFDVVQQRRPGGRGPRQTSFQLVRWRWLMRAAAVPAKVIGMTCSASRS